MSDEKPNDTGNDAQASANTATQSKGLTIDDIKELLKSELDGVRKSLRGEFNRKLKSAADEPEEQTPVKATGNASQDDVAKLVSELKAERQALALDRFLASRGIGDIPAKTLRRSIIAEGALDKPEQWETLWTELEPVFNREPGKTPGPTAKSLSDLGGASGSDRGTKVVSSLGLKEEEIAGLSYEEAKRKLDQFLNQASDTPYHYEPTPRHMRGKPKD